MDNYIFQIIKNKKITVRKTQKAKQKQKPPFFHIASNWMSLKCIQGMTAHWLQDGFGRGGIFLTLVGIWASPLASCVSLNLPTFSFLISKVWKIPDLPTLSFEDTMR